MTARVTGIYWLDSRKPPTLEMWEELALFLAGLTDGWPEEHRVWSWDDSNVESPRPAVSLGVGHD